MKPKHPDAQRFLESYLFDEVERFSELEGRISALTGSERKTAEKEKGDAFEVFAEGYLATQSISQAKNIWAKKIPPNILRRLNLPPKDEGIDGVYENTLGELVAYQVKFRSGRGRLTWRDLSTFVGLSEAADHRVLLTNADHIAKTAKARSKFTAYRGHYFDSLGRDDFEAIRSWLETGRIEHKLLEPFPHNQFALQDISAKLPNHDRGRIVMACGTGKTLLALWAAEQAAAKNIVVLVPSLSLLQQTLQTWARNNHWGRKFRYLAVCSDRSVTREVDSIQLDASDLPFAVGTEPAEVNRFMASPRGAVKVIFSTYQSSPIVAEGSKEFGPFDLGIFDEAHKTAGRAGTAFSFALHDENMPIKKRLFFTATPRHYNVLKKNKEGEAKLVFSMDDEETYGPIFHRLSFSKAAAEDVICGYRVLISVIDSDTVNNHLLDCGEVLVEGDFVRARQVAAQIALKHAVERCEARRVITFHSRVASAKSFSSRGPEGIGMHLPEFSAFHVNGKQSSSDRHDILEQFRLSEKGIVTNSRCLTEGIDIPAVDMVAFVSPRRSRIDIAQAAGRAMRKGSEHSEKEIGYIFVPLFLDRFDGETVEEAVVRSDFSAVSDVLNAMQEHDEELVDIITELHVSRVVGAGCDDSRFREKVEILGPQILLETLRETINADIVERLGDSWKASLALLRGFAEREKHCRVPELHIERGRSLGIWAQNQRAKKKRRELSQSRIADLESVPGWVWFAYEEDFQNGLLRLDEFILREGHARVPDRHSESGFNLGSWVRNRRTEYNAKALSNERIALLEGRKGWVWSVYEEAFKSLLEALESYIAREGNSLVPFKHLEGKVNLGGAVNNWRSRKSLLSSDRVAALNAVDGWSWSALDSQVDIGISALRSFVNREQHSRVPARHIENNFKLGPWVAARRAEKRKDELSAEIIYKLEAVSHWIWDPLQDEFEKNLVALRKLILREGHSRISAKHIEGSVQLGQWVATRRYEYRKGTLSDARTAALESIDGWFWDLFQAALAVLREYVELEGNASPPQGFRQSGFNLGNWCSARRQEFREDKLEKDHVAALESVPGWTWTPPRGPRGRASSGGKMRSKGTS